MEFFNLGSGDKGKSCFGKKWISKTCPEIEALGSIDELNSLMGLIKNQKISKEFKSILEKIQQDLFVIQAGIAGLLLKRNKFEIKKDRIVELENWISSMAKKIDIPKKFVISGSNIQSSWFDYARAVARRAERNALSVKKADKNNYVYLNRLSSLLFVMARICAKKKGAKESSPLY
jgi:cob(I)alamin adenosyltransferase